jgi:adenylate cyclase
LAERRFAYPVAAAEGVPGGGAVDILPAIPLFMEAVRGAGFTNVAVDRDGTRRRIYLTRKVMDHWYLQLAFAPLLEHLGNPALELRPRRLVMKGAKFPGATMPADIRIPLDDNGAMMLDWPLTSYNDSYAHVSFARFSYLEEYYAHVEEYLYGLTSVTNLFPALSEGAETALGLFADAEGARGSALENGSDTEFERYVGLRDEGLQLAGELLAAAPAYIEGELAARSGLPGYEAVLEEAAYCGTLLDYLGTELNHITETQTYLKAALGGKFCILGRVDTGTTDIGVNPFHGEYVNVGTHAVVLDTILSQSFITVLPSLWSVVIAFLFVPVLITGIGGFKPVFRITLVAPAGRCFLPAPPSPCSPFGVSFWARWGRVSP